MINPVHTPLSAARLVRPDPEGLIRKWVCQAEIDAASRSGVALFCAALHHYPIDPLPCFITVVGFHVLSARRRQMKGCVARALGSITVSCRRCGKDYR